MRIVADTMRVNRLEFLPALFRDRDGRVQEMPYPRSEPDPYDVSADLYCPSYEVVKGLFGPPKLGHLEVSIFNTRTYRRDAELEALAKDRLIAAITAKEGTALVQASGGPVAIRDRIELGPFWEEIGSR